MNQNPPTLYPRRVPPVAPRKRTLEYILVGLIVTIVVLLSLPFREDSPRFARRAICLSNVKQQALGILMYAEDESNRIPPVANWMDILKPYTKGERIFWCPAVPLTEWGYAIDASVAGLKLPIAGMGAKMPLTFDAAVSTRSAVSDLSQLPGAGRHDGMNNVSFVDGHAKSFDAGSKVP